MRRSLLIATLVLAWLAESRATTPLADATAASPHPFFARPIRLVAHRGGGALAPENTVAAFRASAARWPDVVLETDVRLTSDGVPVLLHDATVDRTTDGTGEVARTRLSALRALDAGYRFSADGGKTFPSRGRDVRIPTLDEALRALRESRFEIEVKEGPESVPAVVAAIRNAGATARVLLVSPRAEVLTKIRALDPQIATNLDEASARALVDALRSGTSSVARPAGQILSAEPRQLAAAGVGKTEIAGLARGGVAVQAFTIDEPSEMRRLLDLGIASLVTDRPDLLAAVPPSAVADTAPSGPSPTGGAGSAPTAPRALVVLGDSIGDPPAGTTPYAALLGTSLSAAVSDAQVIRAARGGARSRDLAGQVASLPGSLPGPVAVVITIGGNDLRDATASVLAGADRQPRADLVRNVGAALDELVAPGRFGARAEVRTFLATIYDSSDGHGGFRELGCPIPIGKLDTAPLFARWNDDLRALAAARGVTIVDAHQIFLGHGLGSDSPWYLRDCIHPNDAGHAQLALAFGAALGIGHGAASPAAPRSAAHGSATAVATPTVHEGTFEIRLESGSSFKVRSYVDRGDAIEVKRAGIPVTIGRSGIAEITAID